jgi:hypothetical protein
MGQPKCPLGRLPPRARATGLAKIFRRTALVGCRLPHGTCRPAQAAVRRERLWMSMQEIFSPPNRLTSGYKYPTMAEVEPRLELGLQMLFLSRAHRLSLLALVPEEDEQRESCLLCYSTSPEFLRAGLLEARSTAAALLHWAAAPTSRDEDRRRRLLPFSSGSRAPPRSLAAGAPRRCRPPSSAPSPSASLFLARSTSLARPYPSPPPCCCRSRAAPPPLACSALPGAMAERLSPALFPSLHSPSLLPLFSLSTRSECGQDVPVDQPSDQRHPMPCAWAQGHVEAANSRPPPHPVGPQFRVHCASYISP